jgi:phosphatidate cytidylyltransferase
MGKNNRGIIKASPNKSILGFIGGFLGSIAVGILAYFIFFDIFGHLLKMIILGFITALAAIIGDLAESVMKRSAQIKDSGNVIPGRGGILDSIDSIIFAAPAYYITIQFLFNFS